MTFFVQVKNRIRIIARATNAVTPVRNIFQVFPDKKKSCNQ